MIRRFLCALILAAAMSSFGVIYVGAARQHMVPAKQYAAPAQQSAVPDKFITTAGTSFKWMGKPYFVAGVNNHYLTFGTDIEVNRVLDDAKSLGANTIRIFLQPVIGSPDGSMPTIWDWHKKGESAFLAVNGTYLLYWDSKNQRMGINDGPDGLQKVDRVIAWAKRRNLKLIIGFLDFWSYTGGAQQMSAWYITDPALRPTWALTETKQVVDYHFFFSDPRTKHDYMEWVRHVLDRVNRLNGLPYRDDPTIMAWELMNEPLVDSDSLRKQWVAEMSAYVKSIDHVHLVGAGSINETPNDLAKDLIIPTIDFGTWHSYPIHQKITPVQLNERIPRYCATAAIFNKPVLLEEFGYARSNQDYTEAYKQWLDTLTNNRDCGGWLVWKLVSRQQDNQFPEDNYDQFDVKKDNSPLWHVLKDEIVKAHVRKDDLVRE